MPKESYFYLADASEGAPEPFSLAYIAQVEVGLFVLDDSNVMNVLVETEQRATKTSMTLESSSTNNPASTKAMYAKGKGSGAPSDAQAREK